MAEAWLTTAKEIYNKQVTLSIPGYDDLTVYAIIDGLSYSSNFMAAGNDMQDITVHIGRQDDAGFPVTGMLYFPAGTIITIDDIEYQAVNVTGDTGRLTDSSVFTFTLSRHGMTADY
jgi:hypothetical protein